MRHKRFRVTADAVGAPGLIGTSLMPVQRARHGPAGTGPVAEGTRSSGTVAEPDRGPQPAGDRDRSDGHALARQALGLLLCRACAADPDPEAWNELIRRYGRLLLHIAREVGLNESDAADVVQVTWVRLWERGHQIREAASLSAWLATTARRESLRVAAGAKRYVLYADSATEHGHPLLTVTTDVYPVDGDDYQPLLVQALARLPARYEQLIRLLMSDNCPNYEEVGRILDLPMGSIGPMRMRALRLLRATPELARLRSGVSPAAVDSL